MTVEERLPEESTARTSEITLASIFRVALFYGVAGFGGGYSVLAQLRRDLVERRRWLSAEEFLVLAELSKSLPGTPATSLLALLGQRVGGARAGVVAAVAFLLPSAIMMTACGAAYSIMRKATGLTLFFDGMNAAMVGVVGAVTVDLGRAALRSWRDVIVAILCAVLLASHTVSEPILALGAALLGGIVGARVAKRAAAISKDGSPKSERLHSFPLPLFLMAGGGFTILAALVRVFVPIGVATFGGGLAMIPAIEHTVVIERHWLDAKAFADAIALGQITPGPVAICATFIGYRVAGILGAIVATVAMFGPAIILALVVGHSIQRFHESPIVAGALRALAPAVIGMLAAATFSLARAGIDGRLGAAVAVLTFLLLVRFAVSPLWPLVGGGVAHVLLSLLTR
ncbi:MAG: chromate efflux transporter [Polyangiaceae bacterium]